MSWGVSSALPPGPRAPAVVNMVRFFQRPLESLIGWSDQYGDIYAVKLPLFGTCVFVSDPDAIRELMTGDQSDLLAGKANSTIAPLVGEKSVAILDGPEHVRQRKLLLSSFQGTAIQGFRGVIREVAEAEVDSWKEGESFSLHERMGALTFEVIARVVFGYTERERIERFRRALHSVMRLQMLYLTPSALRLDLGRLSPWGQVQRRLKVADALIYEEIARRRQVSDLEDRGDVLSLLLRARDESGEAMSDIELRDELMTMLVVGHETNATALALAFDLLLREPRVLSRLRDELQGDDDTYLDAVVAEALRMRPVLPANMRTLAKPRTVAGWSLPAGVRLSAAIAVVHFNEDLYPRPYEFRPERFAEEGEDVTPYSWLPFGGGIRRCIGAALAQTEMTEVIRAVVSRVDLEPVRPSRDPIVLRGVTLVPRHGTPVRIGNPPVGAGGRRRALSTTSPA